jgi:hypothetical protein
MVSGWRLRLFRVLTISPLAWSIIFVDPEAGFLVTILKNGLLFRNKVALFGLDVEKTRREGGEGLMRVIAEPLNSKSDSDTVETKSLASSDIVAERRP